MTLRALQVSRHLGLAVCFSAILFVLAGCGMVQSVNPFYQPQDVVFDPSILGEWQVAEPGAKRNRVVIKAKGLDAYLTEFSGYDDDRKAEVIWTFEVHQFAYRQNQYVDFIPTAFRIKGKKQNFQVEANEMWFLTPLHSVMRLHHDKQTLSLHWTGEPIALSLFKKEDEAAKQQRLAQEKRQHDILTMTTEELQEQVLGQNLEAGSETNIDLVRKK